MEELWRSLSAAFGDFSLVRDTVDGLSERSFDAAFRRAVEKAAQEGFLIPTDKRLLLEFGEGCGRYDLERQAEHIRAYRLQVETAIKAAAAEAAAKGQVYRVLGLAAGVGLSLVLL